jgi:hypothetical protein
LGTHQKFYYQYYTQIQIQIAIARKEQQQPYHLPLRLIF